MSGINAGPLLDVQRVVAQYGQPVQITSPNESDIVRDDYGRIIKYGRTQWTLNAFPVSPNPSQRELEQVGIFDRVDCLWYLSSLDCSALSLNAASFVLDKNATDTNRMTIIFKKRQYRLVSAQDYSVFADSFLYLVLGGLLK